MADPAQFSLRRSVSNFDFFRSRKVEAVLDKDGLSSRWPRVYGRLWQEYVRCAKIVYAQPAQSQRPSTSRARGLDGWPDDAKPRRVQFHVDMMETALELCRQGRAVIFAPRFVIRLHNQSRKAEFCLEPLQKVDRSNAVVKHVYLLKRHSTVEDERIKKLARGLREIGGNARS